MNKIFTVKKYQAVLQDIADKYMPIAEANEIHPVDRLCFFRAISMGVDPDEWLNNYKLHR